jgi:hypothetical protein
MQKARGNHCIKKILTDIPSGSSSWELLQTNLSDWKQRDRGKPCIKIIISTAHGTLAWSVSCRHNNPIMIVNALLSREWYFSVDMFILVNKFKKRCLFFSVTISRGTLGFHGTQVEKPCYRWFTLLMGTVLFLEVTEFNLDTRNQTLCTFSKCLQQYDSELLIP